jgi:hypothetical protein
MFRDSVKSTGYSLHSPVSPSLSFPCLTMCHHISTGVYQGYLLEGKDDWGVGLTALSSYSDSLELWKPHSRGTLGPVQTCNGIALPLAGRHLKIVGTIKVTWNKFRPEDPQILRASPQSVVFLGDLAPGIYAPRHFWVFISCSWQRNGPSLSPSNKFRVNVTIFV